MKDAINAAVTGTGTDKTDETAAPAAAATATTVARSTGNDVKGRGRPKKRKKTTTKKNFSDLTFTEKQHHKQQQQQQREQQNQKQTPRKKQKSNNTSKSARSITATAREGGGNHKNSEENMDADVDADELLRQVMEEAMTTSTRKHHPTAGSSSEEETVWTQTEKEQFVQCITRLRKDASLSQSHELSDLELCDRLVNEYTGTTRRNPADGRMKPVMWTVDQIQRQFYKYQENYRARNFVLRGLRQTPYPKQVYYHNYRQELKWNKRQLGQNPKNPNTNENNTTNPNTTEETTTSGGGMLAAKEHGLQQILDATNQNIRTTVHTLRAKIAAEHNTGPRDTTATGEATPRIDDGTPYSVGTHVKKYFYEYSGWYEGIILEYNPTTLLYTVEYTDGDQEDLDHDEINTEPFPTVPLFPVGRPIQQYFTTKKKPPPEKGAAAQQNLGWLAGTIIARFFYVPSEKLIYGKKSKWIYQVEYADHDTEQLDESRVRRIVERMEQQQRGNTSKKPKPKTKKPHPNPKHTKEDVARIRQRQKAELKQQRETLNALYDTVADKIQALKEKKKKKKQDRAAAAAAATGGSGTTITTKVPCDYCGKLYSIGPGITIHRKHCSQRNDGTLSKKSKDPGAPTTAATAAEGTTTGTTSSKKITTKVQCQFCGEFFGIGAGFARHQKMCSKKHDDLLHVPDINGIIHCEFCGDPFPTTYDHGTRDDIIYHQNDHCIPALTMNAEAAAVGNGIECKFCGDYVAKGLSIAVHLQRLCKKSPLLNNAPVVAAAPTTTTTAGASTSTIEAQPKQLSPKTKAPLPKELRTHCKESKYWKLNSPLNKEIRSNDATTTTTATSADHTKTPLLQRRSTDSDITATADNAHTKKPLLRRRSTDSAITTTTIFDNNRVECKYCGGFFERGRGIESHQKLWCSKKKKMMLESGNSDGGDKKNWKTKNKKNTEDDNNGKVQCEYCGNFFGKGLAMAIHKGRMHKGRTDKGKFHKDRKSGTKKKVGKDLDAKAKAAASSVTSNTKDIANGNTTNGPQNDKNDDEKVQCEFCGMCFATGMSILVHKKQWCPVIKEINKNKKDSVVDNDKNKSSKKKRLQEPSSSGGNKRSKKIKPTLSIEPVPKASTSDDKLRFPVKLFYMIQQEDTGKSTDFCRWSQDGRSFLLNPNHPDLEKTLQRHFAHSKWLSFSRQLNNYGFVMKDRGFKCYYHPLFYKCRQDPMILETLLPYLPTANRNSTKKESASSSTATKLEAALKVADASKAAADAADPTRKQRKTIVPGKPPQNIGAFHSIKPAWPLAKLLCEVQGCQTLKSREGNGYCNRHHANKNAPNRPAMLCIVERCIQLRAQGGYCDLHFEAKDALEFIASQGKNGGYSTLPPASAPISSSLEGKNHGKTTTAATKSIAAATATITAHSTNVIATEPMTLLYKIGTRIKRYFKSQKNCYIGTVRSYNTSTKMYSIEYDDDGDQECLDLDTIIDVTRLSNKNGRICVLRDLDSPLYDIGTKFERYVGFKLVEKAVTKWSGCYMIGTIKYILLTNNGGGPPLSKNSTKWTYRVVYDHEKGGCVDLSEPDITKSLKMAQARIHFKASSNTGLATNITTTTNKKRLMHKTGSKDDTIKRQKLQPVASMSAGAEFYPPVHPYMSLYVNVEGDKVDYDEATTEYITANSEAETIEESIHENTYSGNITSYDTDDYYRDVDDDDDDMEEDMIIGDDETSDEINVDDVEADDHGMYQLVGEDGEFETVYEMYYEYHNRAVSESSQSLPQHNNKSERTSHPHPSIELYRGDPTESLQGIGMEHWPSGWTKVVVQRQGGQFSGKSAYWYTPKKKYKLRSMVEVKQFLIALQHSKKGDETVAKQYMKTINIASEKDDSKADNDDDDEDDESVELYHRNYPKQLSTDSNEHNIFTVDDDMFHPVLSVSSTRVSNSSLSSGLAQPALARARTELTKDVLDKLTLIGQKTPLTPCAAKLSNAMRYAGNPSQPIGNNDVSTVPPLAATVIEDGSSTTATLKQKGRLSLVKGEEDHLLIEKSWLASYNRLLEYYGTNGHSSVLRSDPDKKLSGWVKRQRNNRREGKLSQGKIDKLDTLNFVWHRLDFAWDSKYNMLIEYQKAHHSCDISTGINRPLAEWTQRQRREYRNRQVFMAQHNGINPETVYKGTELFSKKGTLMSADRVEALEKIPGWFWLNNTNDEVADDTNDMIF